MKDPYRNFIAEGFVVHNSGKTGALISLALAGYELKIIDFDVQSEEVVRGILQYKKSKQEITSAQHDEALSRFDILPASDKIKIIAGTPTIIAAAAWTKATKQLTAWSQAGLTTRDIIVIDSLTFAAKAATHYYQSLNKTLNKKLSWQDFGGVQDLLGKLLDLLYSEAFETNVIVTSHIDLVETQVDSGQKDAKGDPIMNVIDTRAFPASIGKALGPKIPQYFNSTFVAQSEGKEAARKRFIYTVPVGLVDTKSPDLSLPKKLPLDTALRTIFGEPK